MRTNASRLVSVFIALALTGVGLSFTILPIDFVNEAIPKAGVSITRQDAWLALAASPVLLMIGSLFAGLQISRAKVITIAIVIIVIVIGVLGTFSKIFPERIGVWSFVGATAILGLGTIFRRL